MEEYENALNDMKMRSALMKELSNDILNASKKMDNLIDYIEHPMKMLMSNDIKGDLEKMETEIKVAVLIASNKAEVIVNFFNEEGE